MRVAVAIKEVLAAEDLFMQEYNEVRSRQGRYCCGKAPIQTFLDSVPLAKGKKIA